jgi:hypothetical protein
MTKMQNLNKNMRITKKIKMLQTEPDIRQYHFQYVEFRYPNSFIYSYNSAS